MCNSVLKSYRYACAGAPLIPEKIVLLHGWGCDSRTWQPLIPSLQEITDVIAIDLPGFGESEPIAEFTLSAVIDLLAKNIPEKAVVIGWSLGGMLAVQLAAAYPQKITRIITLAANALFVAQHDYSSAMPLAVNQQFNNSFAENPQATLKLFSGLLAQGDANERSLLKQVRALFNAEKINADWLQALLLLSSLDNREAFSALQQMGLHLLAEKDVLVPISAAQSLSSLNSHQCVKVISSAAHALHWSQPDLIAQHIQTFLLPTSVSHSVPNKKLMAQSFSRAASTYDSVASLQRESGEYLLQKLDCNNQAQFVLDLGCGTGYFTPQLHIRFPQANVIGVDIAEGMLHWVRSSYVASNSTALNLMCADAEFLPFADNSIDIIYSNFALQWCLELSNLFAELKRILKPEGQLLFTTLAPNTLHELKSAWQQVDSGVHVNHFVEPERVLASLQGYAFEVVTQEQKKSVMQFKNLQELTKSLKSLGAHNVNSGRALGLTGRKKIELLKQAYEKCRINDMLPATYDVLYIKARKQ